MAKHCNYSIAFKRQLAQEYLAGETFHRLAKHCDISRDSNGICVAKYNTFAFDTDAIAAGMVQAQEARNAEYVAATQLLQLRVQLRRIRAETAAALRRTDQPPTNDLRRAVRPEEIFLVTTFINGRHLCDQVLAKLRGALQ